MEFEVPEAALLAQESMNGVLMGGRNIKVSNYDWGLFIVVLRLVDRQICHKLNRLSKELWKNRNYIIVFTSHRCIRICPNPISKVYLRHSAMLLVVDSLDLPFTARVIGRWTSDC